MLRPLDWPANSVETTVPPDVLDRMIERTEAGFRKLGETEPHWSVLTAEKFRTANIAETKAEFYRTGVDVIGTVWRMLERVGVVPEPGATAIELGCGVGRLTIPLSERVARVVGVDISAPHLRLAADAALERHRVNIEWRQLRRLAELDSLPVSDFFFSLIVLQHNPPPMIAAMLRSLLGRLRPGGIGYFQVPTFTLGYRFSADEYLRQQPMDIEMHCLPQPAIYRLLDTTGCRLLEIREDSSAGENLETISNTFIVQRRE